MKSLYLVVFACALMVGCNTVEGLGKDIKQGGAAIEKAAK